MVHCCAVNCTNSSAKGFRLFRFPQDEMRRKVWIHNCRRGGQWFPTSGSRLCEVHFDDDQWEKQRQDGWKKLKPFAVPTLFDVSNPPELPRPQRKKGKGGIISLLALNGIFYLMQIFDPHLPVYPIAAFIKRLARSALCMPPGIIILPFIENLLMRHPSLKVLINNPYKQDGTDGVNGSPVSERKLRAYANFERVKIIKHFSATLAQNVHSIICLVFFTRIPELIMEDHEVQLCEFLGVSILVYAFTELCTLVHRCMFSLDLQQKLSCRNEFRGEMRQLSKAWKAFAEAKGLDESLSDDSCSVETHDQTPFNDVFFNVYLSRNLDFPNKFQ